MEENEIFKSGKIYGDIAPRTVGILKTSIQFSTQDQGTAKLIFSLSKDGLPLSLSSVATGKIFLRMADGSMFEKTVSIVDQINGKLEYVLQEEISHPGLAKGELNIYYTNGQAMSVCKFSFNIDASLKDQNIVPLAEYYVKDFNTLKTDIEQRAVDINAAVDEMQIKVNEFESTAITLDPRLTTVEGKVETVTAQLAETAKHSIILNEIGVVDKQYEVGDVRRYGAYGDNVHNDTQAFKNAITNALALAKTVKIPEGVFLVTSSILKLTAVKAGLNIEGRGNILSVIKFTPANTSDICLDLSYMSHARLQDFKIQGTGNKGIGIRIGDPAKTVASSTHNCDFINIYCQSLDLGVETNYGWINSFNNLKVRFCNRGMISSGGGNTFTNFVAEANTQYGIKLLGGQSTFNGLVIETNDIGMIIDGGNIVMQNIYLEKNTNGNIVAGTNGTNVDSIVIKGVSSTYHQKFVFDKVSYLEITGISGDIKYNALRISPNVTIANIEESVDMSNSNIYPQTVNASKRKVTPIIVNDLSNETTFTNGMFLDKISNSVKLQQNGTTGSFVNFQGRNAFKFLANVGGTFVGFSLKFDFQNAYLKRCKKLKLKLKLYIDDTTFSDIVNARHQTYANINYRDASNVLKSFDTTVSFNPADTTNGYGLKGNHMSMIYSLDLPSITAGIPDFVSLETVTIFFNITSGNPVAAGTETVYFEGIEVYSHTQVKDILTDHVNVSDFGIPVLIAPNGNRYKLIVDNKGALTTFLVTG